MDEGSPNTVEKGLFLVLEYVEGGSLWRLVSRQTIMGQSKRLYTTKDAVRVLIGVAKGLQYLHERQPTVGLVYRVWGYGFGVQGVGCKVWNPYPSALISVYINSISVSISTHLDIVRDISGHSS